MIGLRKMRIAAHMSLDDVAKRMGVHPSTIYSWESEKSHPRLYQVRRLAMLFGCVESALGLTASDAPKPRPVNREPRKDPTELYKRFTALDMAEQRRIIAYTMPDAYRAAVNRIHSGRLTRDEFTAIERMMGERGRG